MLTIFKNGQFDLYLEKLSTLTDADFADAELTAKISAEFDIYEGVTICWTAGIPHGRKVVSGGVPI